MGSRSRPELVAEEPCTVCWYSGRKVIAPNMAKPSRKPMPEMRLKLRLANSPSGMIGSRARRSTRTNSARPSAASAARPRICVDRQAYWLPPQVVISTSAVIATVSSAAPSQSMRWLLRRRGRCSVATSTSRATPPSGRLT